MTRKTDGGACLMEDNTTPFSLDSFDLKAFLREGEAVVNERLELLLPPSPSRVIQAMRHSLMAGGKRLRPLLCMTAAQAVGGSREDMLNPACALEMIHTYSLIHDDLPALDDDDYRRGRLTCHKAFDEPTAILAGDALLTEAFQVLAACGESGLFPPDRLLRVMASVGEAVGTRGMILGQMLDMEGEKSSYTRKQLEAMHRKKTGALIRVSVTAGSVLAGGSPGQVAALEEYAENLGLAFQVADDILNVEGDPALLGKAVGTDEARCKSTYPKLLGLEGAREFARDLVDKALQAIRFFDNTCDPLRAVATYVIIRRR